MCTYGFCEGRRLCVAERLVLFFIFPILLFKIPHLWPQVRLTGLPEEAAVPPAQCLLHRTEREHKGALPPCMVHGVPLQSAAFFGWAVSRYPCPQAPELTLIYGCDLSLQPQPSNQPLSGWRSRHNVAHKGLSHCSHFSSRLPTVVYLSFCIVHSATAGRKGV